MLYKVISGGQTGADIAGLIAARKCNIQTGGTAPKNFKTENGSNLELKNTYNLTDIGSYKSRTIQNICDSDGTIAFIIHKGSGGTSKTIGYCKYEKWINYYESDDIGFKPVLVINKLDMDLKNIDNTKIKIINWLIKHNITIVNIAGHRLSTAFSKPFYEKPEFDYQQRVTDILVYVFNSLKK